MMSIFSTKIAAVLGHFQNTLRLSSKILHKHCFYFTMVPRESKNNAHSKFCRTNKEYCGIFESVHILCVKFGLILAKCFSFITFQLCFFIVDYKAVGNCSLVYMLLVHFLLFNVVEATSP